MASLLGIFGTISEFVGPYLSKLKPKSDGRPTVELHVNGDGNTIYMAPPPSPLPADSPTVYIQPPDPPRLPSAKKRSRKKPDDPPAPKLLE
jgi:hypothetical protein